MEQQSVVWSVSLSPVKMVAFDCEHLIQMSVAVAVLVSVWEPNESLL